MTNSDPPSVKAEPTESAEAPSGSKAPDEAPESDREPLRAVERTEGVDAKQLETKANTQPGAARGEANSANDNELESKPDPNVVGDSNLAHDEVTDDSRASGGVEVTTTKGIAAKRNEDSNDQSPNAKDDSSTTVDGKVADTSKFSDDDDSGSDRSTADPPGSGLDAFDELVKPSPLLRPRGTPPPLSIAVRPPPSKPPSSSPASPPTSAPAPQGVPSEKPEGGAAASPNEVSKKPERGAAASPNEVSKKPERGAAASPNEAGPDRDSQSGIKATSARRRKRNPTYPPGYKNVLAVLRKRESGSGAPPQDSQGARSVGRPSPLPSPERRASTPPPPASVPAPLPIGEGSLDFLEGDWPTPPTTGDVSLASLEEDWAEPAFFAPAPVLSPLGPPERGRASASEAPPAVSVTKRPPAFSFGQRDRYFILIGLAVLVSFGIGSLFFALIPSSGTLVVTASGPHARMLPSVSIFVDGVERCNDSPCRVEGLSDGVHIVEVKAPGHTSTAGRAVRVDKGEEMPFDLELREAEPATPSNVLDAARRNPKPASADATPTPSIEDLDSNPRRARTSDQSAARHRNRDVARKRAPGPSRGAGAHGTLNINSISGTRVALDGRPLGNTPKLGVRVKAGPHTVVFIHPEHGRKVVRVVVAPGQTGTATASFP